MEFFIKRKKIKIGTRGSKLALAQTNWVIEKLSKIFPELVFEKVIIKTKGDKILDSPLSKIGGKGLFVKEIEEALLREEIDFAVHSLKDMPSDLPQGLEIGCIPERESPRDVLIGRWDSLSEISLNAVIGTSSLRRQAQIRHLRKDIVIKPLRGNVDTRLKKWEKGEFDAIILAEAGLKRLGLKIPFAHPLSVEEMIPAVGQGALAIEVRNSDPETKKILQLLNCKKTSKEVLAERSFLKTMGGGCQVPLGAYAQIINSSLKITGFIASPDGEIFYKETLTGSPEDCEKLGEALAKKLLAQGGEKILEEIFSQGA